jgi:NADH-quinone oxidoreductase subunit I
MYGKGILKSLSVTLKNLFEKKVTLRYPKKIQPMYDRYFGLMKLMRDENGIEKCTGCGICAANCPTHAIELTKGKREDGKPFAQTYRILIQQCMFCGICVEVCPFDALKVGHTYTLAVYDRDHMIYNKEQLLEAVK